MKKISFPLMLTTCLFTLGATPLYAADGGDTEEVRITGLGQLTQRLIKADEDRLLALLEGRAENPQATADAVTAMFHRPAPTEGAPTEEAGDIPNTCAHFSFDEGAVLAAVQALPAGEVTWDALETFLKALGIQTTQGVLALEEAANKECLATGQKPPSLFDRALTEEEAALKREMMENPPQPSPDYFTMATEAAGGHVAPWTDALQAAAEGDEEQQDAARLALVEKMESEFLALWGRLVTENEEKETAIRAAYASDQNVIVDPPASPDALATGHFPTLFQTLKTVGADERAAQIQMAIERLRTRLAMTIRKGHEYQEELDQLQDAQAAEEEVSE